MLRRRGLLSALLCLPAGIALADPSTDPLPVVGAPLGTIELRITEAKYQAFMHDLNDFADFYHLHIVGQPAGLELNGRPILVIWFTRPDGLTVLVTDTTEHERMQAFFYVARDGSSAGDVPAVMAGYLNKMSGYPRFAE